MPWPERRRRVSNNDGTRRRRRRRLCLQCGALGCVLAAVSLGRASVATRSTIRIEGIVILNGLLRLSFDYFAHKTFSHYQPDRKLPPTHVPAPTARYHPNTLVIR
ncbi:hypothetical protein TcasGA2_TC014216 [Tribolium castaneum]|uniref:Uncharacterized protein n=1 Tax=Tribolium castaneum TaxID=7070 RepID=D6W739_TRICA|nr:hypothetical protein TcasGA2_TC014216 [Tribolium castaneum]